MITYKKLSSYIIQEMRKIILYTDSHCHTSNFSFDGHMTGEELIEGAIAKNLKAVVITDHYEMDYPYPTDFPEIFDIPTYLSTIERWQEKANGSLIVRKGIELGYQPHLGKIYEKLIQNHSFDSVIASCHLFKDVDPYYDSSCFSKEKEKSFSEYIHSLCDMMEDFSDFDILAHYDYLSRYSPYEEKKIKYEYVPEAFDRLFSLLISEKKSLEFNTRSIYKLRQIGHTNFFSDEKIYKRYKELGGSMVTLSSDSHDPSTFALLFDEASAFLKKCGFTELTVFEKRKPFGIPIF